MSLCVCVCVFSVIVLHSSQFTKINNLRVYLDRTYFAETKNWKHCSKIIFKCVNSAVGPIFNEKIDKKWNLWVHKQCTDTLFTEDWSKVVATVHVPYINSTACWGKSVKKKKKKKKRKTQKLKTQQPWIQTVPKFSKTNYLNSCYVCKSRHHNLHATIEYIKYYLTAIMWLYLKYILSKATMRNLWSFHLQLTIANIANQMG